jgi:hypothetical protein
LVVRKPARAAQDGAQSDPATMIQVIRSFSDLNSHSKVAGTEATITFTCNQ